MECCLSFLHFARGKERIRKEKPIIVQGKPALVFCSTRKNASEGATALLKRVEQLNRNPFVRDSRLVPILHDAALQLHNQDLKKLVPYGIGFHSAG